MGTERQLSALLHELQHARSPLARARVLARAWRTLRELSPTDRKLLARHVGFDGAEELLEGLSRREGGLAPAMLLRLLANARTTDASTVADLLAAIRDPARRDEALSLGAELATDLLAKREGEESEEVGNALDELRAVDAATTGTTEDEVAAPVSTPGEGEKEEREPASTELQTEQADEVVESVHADPVLPLPAPLVDWSHWSSALEEHRPDATSGRDRSSVVLDTGTRRFEARAVMGAMGAAESPISQLRVLRRELAGFSGSSLTTLRELIESFPDGWSRRRALCALFEAGIPPEVDEALELVVLLGRERDRRWCLGVLARRGDLGGSRLERALELVSSSASRRRIRTTARR